MEDYRTLAGSQTSDLASNREEAPLLLDFEERSSSSQNELSSIPTIPEDATEIEEGQVHMEIRPKELIMPGPKFSSALSGLSAEPKIVPQTRRALADEGGSSLPPDKLPGNKQGFPDDNKYSQPPDKLSGNTQ